MIENLDAIKIMVDVEEDVKRQVADKVKDLEDKIVQLQRREDCLDVGQQTEENLVKDENDNEMSSRPDEDQLEGNGEQSLTNFDFPKLLRLKSIQDQAKQELKKSEVSYSAFEENSYLVERMKHLENLLEDMAESNQEVIDEASQKSEDYRLRVNI